MSFRTTEVRNWQFLYECLFIFFMHLLQNILENTPLPPIEKRKCPVEGCDSSGHLGGLYEKHFSVEACPVFHNLTKDESKVNIINLSHYLHQVLVKYYCQFIC